VAKELEEVRLDQGKTPLVCVAVNVSETVTGAERYPGIRKARFRHLSRRQPLICPDLLISIPH
jgi:hypothetical protein